MVTRLTRNWQMLALRGLVAGLFGLAVLVWPGATLTALVLLFGTYALVYLIAAWAILTGAFEVVAAIDLHNVVEGERQLAWGNLIEHEMMGVH